MSKKYLHVLGITLGVAFLYTFLFLTGFFGTWQERASDSLFLPREPSADIVIIAIDDASIQAIGRWPWRRTVHAELLEKLGNYPLALGYDVSFPEPSTASDDAQLAEAITKTRKTVLPLEAGFVVVGGKVTEARRVLEPIPELQNVADMGLVNTVAGEDSITRFIPAAISRSDGDRDEPFAVILAREYLLDKGLTDYTKRIKAEEGLMRINFVGQPETFKTYSFVDVLDGKIPADAFKDKIVLVGATAINLHDNQVTSVSGSTPMAGVEIHANAIQTVTENRFIVMEHKWVTIAAIFLLSLITGFVMAYLGIIPATITIGVTLVFYLIYAFVYFDKGVIRNIIYPTFVIITSYISLALYRYFVEYNQRRFLKKAFSFYVSSQILDEIINDPKKLSLGGERRVMTVLFADIAGFTSISERIPPDELSHMLNEYLTRASRIIFKYNGVIDKFIGDAVMAFWNAPINDKNHALNACKAAVELEEECDRIKEELKDLNIEDFSVRVGINTGDMVVGNMGSDMRFDYTVLGDNVNLASRLEGINKEYGTRIIITQATYDDVEDHVIARLIDIVAVKGKSKGVRIYELRGIGKPGLKEEQLVREFEDARLRYEKGDFAGALMAFEAIHEVWRDDEPTKLYLKRCREFMENPPHEWDGIYHATSK